MEFGVSAIITESSIPRISELQVLLQRLSHSTGFIRRCRPLVLAAFKLPTPRLLVGKIRGRTTTSPANEPIECNASSNGDPFGQHRSIEPLRRLHQWRGIPTTCLLEFGDSSVCHPLNDAMRCIVVQGSRLDEGYKSSPEREQQSRASSTPSSITAFELSIANQAS